jgi:putative membrane protein
MGIIISILISSIAVFVTANILPAVKIHDFMTAVIVAVVLGFINAFIRPILFILTLPINILTLGLFTFVIMAGIVMFVSYLVPGFYVGGFFPALLFALVLAVINAFLNSLQQQP